MRPGPNHSSGTVSLVALCFVAVLGIALSSYLALCTRAMTLSNRSFQSGLGQQLAEFGLEEGMRAFNKGDWNDWSNGISVDWDVSTYAASKRAVAAVTFPAGKFGQGTTATVKIRIDNYDANALGSPYNSSTTYRLNDLVSYNGIWYRSVYNGHSGKTPANASDSPNLAYWVPAPIPWMWSGDIAYTQYSVVNYNGTWYRCHTATTAGILPTDPLYWSYIPALALSWSNGVAYPFGTMLFDSGAWYYCISAHTSSGSITTTNTTYWAPVLTASGTAGSPGANTYTTGNSYVVGDYIYRAGSSNWFRCNTATTYASGDYNNNPPWVNSASNLPYISWAWRSGVSYSFNDLVFYSASGNGIWYRCKKASASTVPTTTADWENVLTGSNTTSSTGGYGWSSSSINYNLGDVVCYGTAYNWYRCIKAHTSSGSAAPTNTTYWATTPLLSQDWQPNRQYSQYDTVRYKGVWYLGQTSTGNIGQIPTDTSSNYWAAAPHAITPWTSTTYYELDDLVSRSGTWYRCIAPHKNHTPPNTTYWTILKGSGSTYVWNAATAYTVGQYRNYDGLWYKCITATAANDGHTPNDTGYWSATWSQSSNTSVITGAPVIYAEATVLIANSPPIKTQLRATIAPAPLFSNAAGSSTTLTIGSGGLVDSYDGSVRSMNTSSGATATFGYDETTNTPFSSSNHNVGYSATLAAAGTAGTLLSVNSPTIKGFAAASPASTSPFAPLASFGTNVYLQNSDGTTTSPDATALNVDRTRISNSPYVPQFDPLPSGGLISAFSFTNFSKGTALVLANPTTNIGIPGATTPSRYFYSGDLTIGTASATTLNIIGPVILYVSGDLLVTASGSTGVINITSSGSAEIHIGDSLKIDQSGDGIKNLTLDPKKLIIICDTSANTLQYYGDGAYPFYGVIYAPNTTDGDGLNFNNTTSPTATTYAVYGAISAQRITYDSGAYLHYDTSLRYATFGGVDQPYTVTEWRELPIAEAATMP